MIFIIGSIWFWVLVGTFLLAELFWIEAKDSGVGATITLAAFTAVFFFWGDPTVFEWMKANPVDLLIFIGSYIAAGGVWGFIKWYFFLKEAAREYQEKRRSWLQNKGITKADLGTVVPEKLRSEWSKQHAYNLARPKASERKSDIIMWMAYWPWSLLWTLIRDPFRHLYNFCAAKMEKMSQKVFKNVGFEDDADVPPLDIEGFE
jgi:hypothetical protein